MWQYTYNADFPYWVDGDDAWGDEWGISSKGLDLSYVKKAWLQKYLDKYSENGEELVEDPVEEPVEDPVEEPIGGEGLFFRSKHVMNIRSKPGTTYGVVGQLPADTLVMAIDIGGNNCWIKTELGWICKNLNGRDYLVLEE